LYQLFCENEVIARLRLNKIKKRNFIRALKI